MEHVRTSALKEVVRTLTGIPGLVGVAARRRWSYSSGHLPAINVCWANEQRGKVHGIPSRRITPRDMILRVNIVTTVADSPEDDPPEYELDAYQAEVESRLAANRTLSGPTGKTPLVRDLLWDRTETGENSGSAPGGSGTVTVTSLFFDVLTFHREGRPTHPLQD